MAQKSRWNGRDKVVDDTRRLEYLRAHLGQLKKALERGIPVEAYFVWTLLDNYEWAEGYRPDSCFGIVHVDRKTMKRVPKKSALWYTKVVKTGALV